MMQPTTPSPTHSKTTMVGVSKSTVSLASLPWPVPSTAKQTDLLALLPSELHRATARSPTRTFNIAINDLDEFNVGPVSDSNATTNNVDENASVGTVVQITALAADADATNNTITYSLHNNDGGRFQIDSVTGIVTVAGAIDREADGASRTITVRATSSDGSFTDQNFYYCHQRSR
jgi:hypothetical protein